MATCNPTVMILCGDVRSVPRYAMRVIGQMVARDRVFHSLNVRSGWPVWGGSSSTATPKLRSWRVWPSRGSSSRTQVRSEAEGFRQVQLCGVEGGHHIACSAPLVDGLRGVADHHQMGVAALVEEDFLNYGVGVCASSRSRKSVLIFGLAAPSRVTSSARLFSHPTLPCLEELLTRMRDGMRRSARWPGSSSRPPSRGSGSPRAGAAMMAAYCW